MATGYVSQITGPIPGHKIYEHQETKPMERNYPKSKQETNGINVQGKRYLGSFSNRGAVTPKDHIQDNVKRIREIQRASRLRQEENRNNRGPLKSTSRPNSSTYLSGTQSGRNYSSYRDNDENFNSCATQTSNSRRTPSREDWRSESPFKSSGTQTTADKQTMYNYANNPSNHTDHFQPRRVQSANNINTLHLKIPQDNSPSQRNNSNAGNYLKAHEKTGPPLELTSYPIEPIPRRPRQDKLTVPKASTAREVQLIRRDIDFIRANAYAAKSARMKRSASSDNLYSIQKKGHEQMNQYKRGEVPNYLVKRQQRQREDEEIYVANLPDPEQPPGHKKMPEKERKATLDLLKSTENELLSELGRLPIRTDTLKLKTRKQEIEQKLNELEEAIKIFSKPKVFIRIDE